ncbi:MAG: hypothetical protein QXM16_03680 [Nitrososphaerota archaeon]
MSEFHLNAKRSYLLYNDGCVICRELAAKVQEYSRHPLQILPLTSREAQELISQTYGEKPPDSFFYIIQDGDRIKALHGVRAALRIGAAVGVTNSIRLLGVYLDYRRRLAEQAGRTRSGCCGILEEDEEL